MEKVIFTPTEFYFKKHNPGPMELINLVEKTAGHPEGIKNIEIEIERLVNLDSIVPLYQAISHITPTTNIYLSKVLELRINRKIGIQNLAEEIMLTEHILSSHPSHHISMVYSKLGLYCWPNEIPEFISNIKKLVVMGNPVGYQVFLYFLEMVNSDTGIDSKRRSELKGGIVKTYKEIEDVFDRKFGNFIIQIYTELLTITSRNRGYSLVFELAEFFPNEALGFVVEGFSVLPKNEILRILKHLPLDASFIKQLGTVNGSSYESELFEYVFRGTNIEDLDIFKMSVEFWTKRFGKSQMDDENQSQEFDGKSSVFNHVISKITSEYLNMDEENVDYVDHHVFGFYSTAAKNYAKSTAEFLLKHQQSIPKRISGSLLQKIGKSLDRNTSLLLKQGLVSPYLKCLYYYIIEDPLTPTLLTSLDFNEKEDVKVGVYIISRYQFSHEDLRAILHMSSKGCLSTNEIRAECLLRLNIVDDFSEGWDLDKVIRFYYLVKKNPQDYARYNTSFYSLFLKKAPFDRCFSIVQMLGRPIPAEILQHIYDNISVYPFIEICCFNNDLLVNLDCVYPFVEIEAYKFISEFGTITDHRDYYQSLKSLLMVVEKKIESENRLLEILLGLLQISDSSIARRIMEIFNDYKGHYDTFKTTYYLASAYGTPSLTDSQPLILKGLTKCLRKSDGPEAFSNAIALDIGRVRNVQAELDTSNKKTAVNLVRNMVSDFRGKPLNRLYQSEKKVTEQGFLQNIRSI